MIRAFFFAAATLLVACAGGATSTPPSSPSTARRSATVSSEVPAESPAELARMRQAYLDPRAGEEPIEQAPLPGVEPLSPSERKLVARCDKARDRALSKAKKTKTATLANADATVAKAVNRVDKRCGRLQALNEVDGFAKMRDDRAQAEMRLVAKALAESSAVCTNGAANPPADVCTMTKDGMAWDRAGWSCVAQALSADEKQSFMMGAAYVYSFEVDPTLRTYAVVARGCQYLGDDKRAETELVLRGELGDNASASRTIYRRAFTK